MHEAASRGEAVAQVTALTGEIPPTRNVKSHGAGAMGARWSGRRLDVADPNNLQEAWQ